MPDTYPPVDSCFDHCQFGTICLLIFFFPLHLPFYAGSFSVISYSSFYGREWLGINFSKKYFVAVNLSTSLITTFLLALFICNFRCCQSTLLWFFRFPLFLIKYCNWFASTSPDWIGFIRFWYVFFTVKVVMLCFLSIFVLTYLLIGLWICFVVSEMF